MGNPSANGCMASRSTLPITCCPTISRVSRATAMVTLMGVLFSPDESRQFVHLHRPFTFLNRCGMRDRIGREGGGMGGDPVGDRLMDDAEQPSDGALAHPFERELHRLRVDRRARSLLLGQRGEVALAGEAA